MQPRYNDFVMILIICFRRNGMEFSCLGSRLLCLATDSLLHQGDPRPGYQNRSNTRASRTSLRDRRQPVSGCNTSVSLFYSYCVCSTMCLLYFHRKMIGSHIRISTWSNIIKRNQWQNDLHNQ